MGVIRIPRLTQTYHIKMKGLSETENNQLLEQIYNDFYGELKDKRAKGESLDIDDIDANLSKIDQILISRSDPSRGNKTGERRSVGNSNTLGNGLRDSITSQDSKKSPRQSIYKNVRMSGDGRSALVTGCSIVETRNSANISKQSHGGDDHTPWD